MNFSELHSFKTVTNDVYHTFIEQAPTDEDREGFIDFIEEFNAMIDDIISNKVCLFLDE